MVTFRFYVVSTVAFFLALAVGVVVGSVLDEGIVNSLQDRLERVEENLDDTVASIDLKNREIAELEGFAESVAPFAVQGRLQGTSTLVVAESGLAEEPLRDLVRRLGESGSRVEGIVWLDPRWNLADREDRVGAAALVPDPPTSRPALRRELWDAVLAPAAAAGGGGTATGDGTATTVAPGGQDPAPDDVPTTTAPAGTTAEPPTTAEVEPDEPATAFSAPELAELAALGLVRLERIEPAADTGGATLLVAVTGTGSTMEVPGEPTAELLAAAGERAVPTVVAELAADGDAPERRGRILGELPSGGVVRFSTVDDLDLVAGRVATVLALADARDGRYGRYGFGAGTDGVLPRWQGP